MPAVFLTQVRHAAAQFAQRLTTVHSEGPHVTIGLDIGSTSLKIVALGAHKKSGPRSILGSHLVPLSGESDSEALPRAIREGIDALRLSHRTVNLAVSGQGVIIRIVELPTMKPAELKQALPYEVQRHLPFQLQDVIIDGMVLGPAEAGKSWVLTVACKKDLLEHRIAWVQRAGFQVGLVDVDALALANGFLANGHSTSRSAGTCALINVGAQCTNLVMFKGAMPYLVRDIPWGGEKLIHTVAEQVGRERAVVGQELIQGPLSEEVRNALQVASEILITELQLSFDYFENRFGQPPEEILMTGGWGQFPEFVGALQRHLTQRVSGWVPPGLPAQYAVAYGLALRTD